VELVSDYVDDRLPVRERLRFEEHLAVCGPCRSYFDQMRDTIRLTGELREEALDPALKDAAVEAFRDWKGGVACSPTSSCTRATEVSTAATRGRWASGST
jgi:anti-sigma factor RsiW